MGVNNSCVIPSVLLTVFKLRAVQGRTERDCCQCSDGLSFTQAWFLLKYVSYSSLYLCRLC